MIRTKKDVMRSLLKRAFEQNRGAEVILLIQWRRAFSRHNANLGLKKFAQKFKLSEFKGTYKDTDSRCINAFHFNAHIDGRSETLSDNSNLAGTDKLKFLIKSSSIVLDYSAILRQRERDLKTNKKDVDWTFKFLPSSRVLN